MTVLDALDLDRLAGPTRASASTSADRVLGHLVRFPAVRGGANSLATPIPPRAAGSIANEMRTQ